MYTAVRHCQRNVDIDVEDGFNEPDRYDGTCIAELVNMLPRIIAALRQPQTDALKIAREALERIEVATRNEVRAGDKGYVSRYGINGITRAALEQSK
jgi:hypothetical protein